MTKAILRQALDALQAALSDDQPYIERSVAAIAALQAAIDAPEPKPIAWRYRTKADWSSNWSNWVPCSQEQYNDYVKASTLHDWTYDAQALYLHPPAEREPLSDAEINQAAQKMAECFDYPWKEMPEVGKRNMRSHARSVIEAAHGIGVKP